MPNINPLMPLDLIPGHQLTISENVVLWSSNGTLVRKFTFSESSNLMAVFACFPDNQSKSNGNNHGNINNRNQSLKTGPTFERFNQTERNQTHFRGSKGIRNHDNHNDSLHGMHINPNTTHISSNHSQHNNSIVILQSKYLNIYYFSGSFHIVSLPFQVSKITPCEYGLVLSRDFSFVSSETDEQFPKFYLLSNPLLDPEPIHTSSLISISLSEELIYFKSSSNLQYCVTYDNPRNKINLYYIRHHTTAADLYHVRRNRAQLPNYPYISQTTNNTTSSLFVPHNLMLSSIASFQIDSNENSAEISVLSLSFNSESAVIISNNFLKTVHIILLKLSGGYLSTPVITKSFNMSGSFPLLLSGFQSHPVLLILNSPTSFYLFDPFLDLRSLVVNFPSHWNKITKLGNYEFDPTGYIFVHSESICYNIHLTLVPKDELVLKVFLGLKYVMNLKSFQCLSLGWTLLLHSNPKISEWEALVSFIILQLFPISQLNTEEYDNSFLNDYKIDSFSLLEIVPMTLKLSSTFPDDAILHPHLQPHIIIILHYIREELRIESINCNDVFRIGKLLTYITNWAGWPDSWKLNYGIIPNINQQVIYPHQHMLQDPPNVIKTMSSLFSIVNDAITPFPLLSELYSNPVLDNLTPLSIKVCELFSLLRKNPRYILDFMKSAEFSKKFLNNISTGIQYTIFKCISNLSASLTTSLFDSSTNPLTTSESADIPNKKIWDILGRDDLLFSALYTNCEPRQAVSTNKEVLKDFSCIIGSIGDSELLSAWDEQTETDRNQISRLIFSADRRFYEVSKLLQSSKPRIVTMEQLPNMSEIEILNRQEEIFYSSGLRTCTVPIGRAAFYYSARKPLATEKYPIPKLVFTIMLKPRDITLTLQKNTISEDNLSWGYFHNGVSSGLSLSKDAASVNGNWITFNKPQELNSQHAGFLLGIGLNGHLNYLEEWHIYNYLGPKHAHTTMALLMGMAASNLRLMDTKLTKVLSVHIFALLPPGSNNLNVSVEVQTAGVIGMGLLYLESSHRRMTETFLGELEGRSRIFTEESIKIHTNEGYKLATGIALGLINLGKGSDLKGLNDIKIVERLMTRAVSPRDVQTNQLEISIPGSIVAILLIFLKTNNFEISRKLAPPEAPEAYNYIRPDLLLVRTLACHVVMWDNINDSDLWVEKNIPPTVLSSVLSHDNLNYTSDKLPYYFIKAGLNMALGLKYSSSGNLKIRDRMIIFLDSICKLTEHTVTQHDQQLAKQSLLHIQNSLCLSLSLVMAGTGDLEVLRRLRRLSLKTRKDTCGVQIATSLALGILFLGGGQYRFGHDNFSIAALLISTYPVFPRVLADNTSYLQPLRYFWSLAAKPSCIVARDVETGQPCSVDLVIEQKSGMKIHKQTPCLIPSLRESKSVSTNSDEYNKVIFDLSSANTPLARAFLQSLTIYVSRKKTFLSKATEILQQNNQGNSSIGMASSLLATGNYNYNNNNYYSNNILNNNNNTPTLLSNILSKTNILSELNMENYSFSNGKFLFIHLSFLLYINKKKNLINHIYIHIYL